MDSDPSPLSKTAKYKKITKPLLERKRRARINRCLDELKELMVGALEITDENLSKLEKADILELTVNHLTKLHQMKDPVLEAEKFQAGFVRCAAEACKFIKSAPDQDSRVCRNLVDNLRRLVPEPPLSIQVPERPSFSPPVSPSSIVSDRQQYYSDVERSLSDAEDSVYNDGIIKYFRSENKPANTPQAFRVQNKSLDTSKSQLNGHCPKYDGFLQDSLKNRNNFSAKAPFECKDVILQKIRQHIMDKREHENVGTEKLDNHNGSLWDSRIPRFHSESMYQNISADSYKNDSDTLDLRIVRLPGTLAPEIFTSKTEQFQGMPMPPVPEEGKRHVASSVPKQYVHTMDYNNLPPKKKIKFMKFQEYRKLDDERRRYEAFAEEQKHKISEEILLASADDDVKWRPW